MRHLLKISLITIFILGVSFSAMSVEKKVLNHTNYDSWKSIDKDFIISHNGKFISYVISPQIGDSYLYIYDVANGKLDSIPRGKTPQFSVENDFIVFNVKAQNDSIRALKLKKTKKDKLPKDSLFIRNLISGDISKIPNLKSWKIPEDGGNWLAYMIEKKKEEPKDTAEVKEKGKNQIKKTRIKRLKSLNQKVILLYYIVL